MNFQTNFASVKKQIQYLEFRFITLQCFHEDVVKMMRVIFFGWMK